MTKYILIAQRWFILTVICLTNFSNNMTWLTYAPISSYTIDFYETKNAPTFFHVIYMICAPMGFVAMWTTEKFGLRIACLIGAWLNFCGTLFRLYASNTLFFDTKWRFLVTFAGQILAACAQPFSMYLPAKLAAIWFPPSQRVVANSFASLSSPLGAATMYALSPHIVNSENPKNFFVLNGIVTIAAGLSALLSLGVTHSKPKSAINDFTENKNTTKDFLLGICLAFRSKSFIILMLGLGSGFGLFNSLYNNLQPALCAMGYSNFFSGAIGAGMIVSGLFFSAIFGIFVDRTQLLEETIKMCMCGCAIFSCAIMILINFNNQELLIALAVLAFGASSLAIYPIGLELGVETTFPVPESISTGLLVLIGQCFGVFYVFLTSLLKQSPTKKELLYQICTLNEVPSGVYNWKISMMTWNICIVFTCVLFTFTFWPKYKRIEHENNKKISKNLCKS